MAGVNHPQAVFLSIGSNLGNKLDNCLKGIAAVAATDGCDLLGVSRFYRTSPVDYTDQDWFINAAISIATSLKPLVLLDQLVRIQRDVGRTDNTIRYGPRVLDLDILLYGNRIIQTPRLEIPHPRMHKRAFVLQPICDMNPAVEHPVLHKTATALLGLLDDDQQVILLENQPRLPTGRMT